MNQKTLQSQPSTEGTAKIVYILYLVSVFFGLTAIIGLVMAYIYKTDAPPWLQAHYQYQIRTFWIGLLYLLIGSILTFIMVGYLIFLFWIVWLIVRCVKGLKLLNQQAAPPNPTEWLF